MKQARILIIQFRAREVTADLERASIVRELGEGVTVSCLSALNDSVTWFEPSIMLQNVDGVIFGGSGDYDFDGGRTDDDEAKATSYALLTKLRPLLDYIFTHDIPTLGICYGHQIIGAYAGAEVVNDEIQKKSRSHEVAVVVNKDAYCICADVPDTFYAHYGHKDSLDRVPEGAVLLMKGGEACKVSALCYKKNIFTTQFHPELTIDDLRLRVEATPGYLPEDVAIEELFVSVSSSNTILKNFGTLVQSKVAED
ncbi:gamma-glutamyl-gamma-aminobutyrate hydrolase family protein [Patescibacteria group bacterium]|nr:gamma-glutamyl-gamma-aminobutyrate hydrolase family protein [Patescibacteria group bacterium]